MKSLWFVFYNIIIIPFLYVGSRIVGIFNEKMRRGIIGRKRIFENLILDALSIDKSKKMIWFH